MHNESGLEVRQRGEHTNRWRLTEGAKPSASFQIRIRCRTCRRPGSSWAPAWIVPLTPLDHFAVAGYGVLGGVVGQDRVTAGAAVHPVVLGAAALAGVDLVVAPAADEQVGVSPADQRVGAGPSLEHVVLGGADQPVRTSVPYPRHRDRRPGE